MTGERSPDAEILRRSKDIEIARETPDALET